MGSMGGGEQLTAADHCVDERLVSFVEEIFHHCFPIVAKYYELVFEEVDVSPLVSAVDER